MVELGRYTDFNITLYGNAYFYLGKNLCSFCVVYGVKIFVW